MPNTYTQLFVHCVYATKYRAALLDSHWDESLRMYISGVVRNHEHKMLAINNMPDHLHMLVGLNPKQSISDFMKVVKGDSSEWINKEGFTSRKFQWQEGFGALSYGKTQVPDVIKYIAMQQEHHKMISFIDEYKKILDRFEVKFDERYLFKLPE